MLGKLHSFTWGIFSIFQHYFLKRLSFLPLNGLHALVKNYLTIYVRAYFWAFSSVSLVYLSAFVPVPHSSDQKAMAPHSSTLAWKIPWMEEHDRLQFMGSLRVGHGWVTSLSLFTFLHWRRKWQPTPVFLPGKSQGRGSLVGCHLWGRTESDTTEVTQQQQ